MTEPIEDSNCETAMADNGLLQYVERQDPATEAVDNRTVEELDEADNYQTDVEPSQHHENKHNPILEAYGAESYRTDVGHELEQGETHSTGFTGVEAPFEEKKDQNNQSFACSIEGCWGSFRHSEDLKLHMLTHTTIDRKNRYVPRLVVDGYEHRTPEAESQQTCQHCGTMLANKSDMGEHIKDRHPEQLSCCRDCGQTFDDYGRYRTHRSQHYMERLNSFAQQALVPRPFDFPSYDKEKDTAGRFRSADESQREEMASSGEAENSQRISEHHSENVAQLDGGGIEVQSTQQRTNLPSSHCITCRRREIKCDEIKPGCYNCRVSGYNCEGYRVHCHQQSILPQSPLQSEEQVPPARCGIEAECIQRTVDDQLENSYLDTDRKVADMHQLALPQASEAEHLVGAMVHLQLGEKELPPQCHICGMAVRSSTELFYHKQDAHPEPLQLGDRQNTGDGSGATTPAFGQASVASIITSTEELQTVEEVTEVPDVPTGSKQAAAHITPTKAPRALEVIELNESFEEEKLSPDENPLLPQPPYTYPQISLYLKQSAHAIFRQSMEFAEDLRQATSKKAIDWDTFKLEIEVVRERFGVVDEWLARLFEVVDGMPEDSERNGLGLGSMGFGGKDNAKAVLEQFIREFLEMTLGDKGKDGFWDWESEDEVEEFKIRAEACFGALKALDF